MCVRAWMRSCICGLDRRDDNIDHSVNLFSISFQSLLVFERGEAQTNTLQKKYFKNQKRQIHRSAQNTIVICLKCFEKKEKEPK